MKSDYQCRTCNHVFEFEKEFGGVFPPDRPCPNCGGEAPRIYTAPVTAIAEGNNGVTYHPSAFTPGGKKRRRRLT